MSATFWWCEACKTTHPFPEFHGGRLSREKAIDAVFEASKDSVNSSRVSAGLVDALAARRSAMPLSCYCPRSR
jgi:hypothetical protein